HSAKTARLASRDADFQKRQGGTETRRSDHCWIGRLPPEFPKTDKTLRVSAPSCSLDPSLPGVAQDGFEQLLLLGDELLGALVAAVRGGLTAHALAVDFDPHLSFVDVDDPEVAVAVLLDRRAGQRARLGLESELDRVALFDVVLDRKSTSL